MIAFILTLGIVILTISYVIHVGFYRDRLTITEAQLENYKAEAGRISVQWIDHPNADNPKSPHKLLQVITPEKRFKFTPSQLQVAEARADRYIRPDEL